MVELAAEVVMEESAVADEAWVEAAESMRTWTTTASESIALMAGGCGFRGG